MHAFDADARAIAALPELVEAARNLVEAIDRNEWNKHEVEVRRILARIESGGE